jgi:hypothetical protein
MILKKTAFTIIVVVSFFSFASAQLTPGDTGCIRWRDSLIVAGIRSLDVDDFFGARRYFTAAYECGMSRDSMSYFAAEMYLRRYVLDTALIFNQSIEKSASLKRELWAEQRSRIYRILGRTDTADSLLLNGTRSFRHELSLAVSGSRRDMVIGPITFLPQQITITPGDDFDDLGKSTFRYKLTQLSMPLVRRLSIAADLQSEFPVPTRYSFSETYDTLMYNAGCKIAAGDGMSIPLSAAAYRARIHRDGKIDHYTSITVSAAAGKKLVVTLGSEEKWIRHQGLDDARTEAGCNLLFRSRRLQRSFGVILAHHYSKFDLYQNKITSKTGIYDPLPLGFVDTLIDGDQYRYYLDRACTKQPDDPDLLNYYWRDQPGMRFLSPLPEHDISATLRTSFMTILPFQINMTLFGFIQGVLFTKQVEWFSTDEPVFAYFDDLYDKYAIIYNAADGSYYLSKDRSQLSYTPAQLTPLRRYEKQRADCFLSLSLVIDREFGRFGKLYFMANGFKGFSTLGATDPVASFNYGWELSAGWKKDLVVRQ